MSLLKKPLLDNLPIQETFDAIGEKLGMSIKMIPFETPNDITSNLDNIDAVYLGGWILSIGQTS